MITINGKKYENVEKKVILGSFSSTKFDNGIKKVKKGISPRINFYIDDKNNISITIETIYSIDDFKNMETLSSIDFNEYITDIIYGDDIYTEKMTWYTMNSQQYTTILMKKSDDTYIINMDIISDEFEHLEININEEFKL